MNHPDEPGIFMWSRPLSVPVLTFSHKSGSSDGSSDLSPRLSNYHPGNTPLPSVHPPSICLFKKTTFVFSKRHLITWYFELITHSHHGKASETMGIRQAAMYRSWQLSHVFWRHAIAHYIMGVFVDHSEFQTTDTPSLSILVCQKDTLVLLSRKQDENKESLHCKRIGPPLYHYGWLSLRACVWFGLQCLSIHPFNSYMQSKN